MKVFWYDGYDYEVDIAELERNDGICYIWDTRQGWMRLNLELKDGRLSWIQSNTVNERPADALVAQHHGAGTSQLRTREKTTNNHDASAIRF